MKKTLGYPALSFIQDLCPADENLNVAETLLDSLYNDSQILGKQIITQLLELDVMKDNLQSLQKGISAMIGAKHQLSAMNISKDDLALTLSVPICERKLSLQSQREWQKTLRTKADLNSPLGADITFDDFFETITRAMKLAQCNETMTKSAETKHEQRNHPTIPQNFGTAEKLCIFCNEPFHDKPLLCPKLPTMTRQDILSSVKSNKACTLCYDPTQYTKDCQLPPCNINSCGKNHSRFVHVENKFKKNQQTIKSETDICKVKPHSNLTYQPTHQAICKSVKAYVIAPDRHRLHESYLIHGQK